MQNRKLVQVVIWFVVVSMVLGLLVGAIAILT
jgi:hypothetical protein